MTLALLALLNLQLATVVVYCGREWRSASFYRREHLQFRDDELVYRDLLAEAVTRGNRMGAVIAGGNHDRRADRNRNERNDKVVAHGSSFLGWDK